MAIKPNAGRTAPFLVFASVSFGAFHGVPTILRIGPCRFFFYSADGSEPPHVHVACGRAKAKFWLEPVAYASASGFNARELLDIQNLVAAHRLPFLEAWHAYFGPAR